MEQPPNEINVQVTEHPTDMYRLNVVVREIQHDMECDKVELQVQLIFINWVNRNNLKSGILLKDTTYC